MSTRPGQQLKPAGRFSPASSMLLQRKCACGTHTPGGAECATCAGRKTRLQPALRIGANDDPLEHEADRVAEQVLTMPARIDAGRAPPRIQRSSYSPVAVGEDVPASVHQAIGSAGRPLDEPLRHDMEQRLGHDFSGVRVHSDGAAEQAALDVDAQAYTVGNDIVFGRGHFAPSTLAGRLLLAHELAHVVQQDGRTDRLSRSPAARAPSSRVPSASRRPTAAAAGRAPPGPYVIETGPPRPEQMTKTEFLAALRIRLIEDCEAELAPHGFTAAGCPFILRSIEHYSRLPVSALLGIVERFGRPPRGATAATAIAAVVANARTVARRLARRRSPRLQSARADGRILPAEQDPFSVQARLGEGRAIDPALRNRMESSLGANLESVRFHDDGAAAQIGREIGARAFTVGQHVGFAEGEYRPGSASGDRLIAHELVHTIQQSPSRDRASGASDYRSLEAEADRTAETASNGGKIAPSRLHGSGPAIQRIPVVVAGAIELGEVALVATEVAAVSAEVTVTAEAVLVVTAEAAAPVVAEAAVPVLAGAAETTVVSLPAAAAVSSTTANVATATVAIGAATTLSSDSPRSGEEDRRRRNCLQNNRYAQSCDEEVSLEEQVQEFIIRQGYDYTSLGDCEGMSEFPPGIIRDCALASGVNFHCHISPSLDPISRTTRPGGVVSAFGCTCCNAEGQRGLEWMGLHWSPGA